MEIDNKWCLTMYGHDWTASITSQLECQALCLQTSNCVGISYSYRAGMMNSCFICKNDVLDQNYYGFAFYRMPGKNNYIGNLQIHKHLYYTQGVIAPHIILIIDCSNDADCAGNADTCVSNYCHCGSSMKCMGRAHTPGNTATCEEGECKCSDHDECSEYDMCTLGVCQQGML